MKDSAICLKSAELIDSGKEKYSCDAIPESTQGNILANGYSRLFSPYTGDEIGYPGDKWLEDILDNHEEEKQWRVLALLFFHEMLKSEGR